MASRPIHIVTWLACIVVSLCFTASAAETTSLTGPVLPLYRELRSAGIDQQQVFKIREADVDREDIHISLNDGVIGFLQNIDGHITGAYFQGDGEILIRPPDRRERASLGLFTGAGVLEEKFSSAYFRFNDDTAAELQPFLRPADDAAGFVSRNDPAAKRLAAVDAMRLCITFTSGRTSTPPDELPPLPDRLLHARLAGVHYGVIDVYFDTRSAEQIVVGKLSSAGEQTYYDLWMSFPMQSLRKLPAGKSRFHGPTGPAWTRDAIEVTKYTVTSSVTPPRELAAEAKLDFVVKQGGPRVVLFELSRDLLVKHADFGGQPLEIIQNEAVEGSELARSGNDLVAVAFPEPLKLGDHLTLRMTYAGAVLSDAGGGLVYVGARGTWYPNRGIAMSNYDLTFRFPQSWTLVATGKQVSLVREGSDWVGHWVSERPIPIAGFNLGEYVRTTTKTGTIEVSNYATRSVERAMPAPKEPVVASTEGSGLAPTTSGPASLARDVPDPAQSGQLLADRAAETLEALSQMLGPYAFTSLSLTQRPGMESQGWPGLIYLSSYVYLTPAELNAMKLPAGDKILFASVMMPHELAHQWYGDKVSWASYHEQWLLEALANYCSLMLLERTRPADAQTMLETYRQVLAAKGKDGRRNVEAGPVTLGVRLSSSLFPEGYEIITYGRGTWLIHMLRCMLRDASRTPSNPSGDDGRFLAVLRGLVDRYESKEITNADFEEALEEALPASLWFENRKSLDWFFDSWVNGTAFPRVELKDVKISSRPGGSTVSGTIKQDSAPADLVTSVPVYAVVAGNRVYLGRVFAEGEETRFTLPATSKATSVVLDPHSSVLTLP